MTHFYGSIPKSSRKPEATAGGTKISGLTVRAASRDGAVEVRLWHNEEQNRDEFVVVQVPHEGVGISRVLHQGVVGAGP